jgi:hypothetical protein
MSQGSSVIIVTRLRLDHGSFRGKIRDIPASGTALRSTEPSIQGVQRDLSLRLKRPGRETKN